MPDMSSQPASNWSDEADDSRTKLHHAAAAGNLQKVRDLVHSGVPVDAYDDDYVTCLQIAAANGDTILVSLLIDLGADIDFSNQVGLTAFHHACREGRLNVVECLLQRGADIKKATFLGATGLTLAAAGGHLDVVKKLVGLHLDVSPKTLPLCPLPLIVAAVGWSPQICGYLTSRGAPVDECLPALFNLNPLSAVILCSRPENSYNTIVSALLDLGADPVRKLFHKGKTSRSAIELANELNREEILVNLHDKNRIRHDLAQPIDFRQLLRENAINKLPEALQVKTSNLADAVTPLMCAVAIGSTAGVSKLIGMRYNVDAQETKYGYSALMFAAFLREHEMINALLDAGAGVERTEPNTLQQTSYDLYLCNSEIDPEIRAHLHRYKPKPKKLNEGGKRFLQSSGGAKTLTKRFGQLTQIMSSAKSQLSLSADPEDCGSVIPMRDWVENRIQSSLVDGRNHRKLVRVEQILHRLRHISPPLTRCLDSELEAVRSLAAEYSTFALTTFYDRYSETHIERRVESEPTSLEYDVAMKYAKEYSYKGKDQLTSIRKLTRVMPSSSALFQRNSDSDRRPAVPVRYRNSVCADGNLYSLRTTPRMLKKSRESLILENGENSPGRTSLQNQFLFPPVNNDFIHPNIRKSVSTPSLPNPTVLPLIAPRITEHHSYSMRSTMPLHDPHGKENIIWNEMRARGLADYVQVMINEEIDYETFFALTHEDLQKMRIHDQATIDTIMNLQNKLHEQWTSSSYM